MYNWTTAQVKERAKNSFRTFGYWIPFLIMLILSFIPFYSDSSGSFVSLLFHFYSWFLPYLALPFTEYFLRKAVPKWLQP